ncbi:MAG: hypothetical protein H7333_03160 [Bdellovibrionales bacterium]|nr:hypothetical protein [Oligoflexia bacterium]
MRLKFSFALALLGFSAMPGASQAKTVRLDAPGKFFAEYDVTNQGGLGTCYAHPATVLVDEFLGRNHDGATTFRRASPLGTALFAVQRSTCSDTRDVSWLSNQPLSLKSIDENAPHGVCQASVKSIRVSDIEGGYVSLAAAAYLSAGKRLAYNDLEGKLASDAIEPAGFSKTDLFGETLDQAFSACRTQLAQIISPHHDGQTRVTKGDLLKLSEVYLSACERFESELDRVRFTWVSPPQEFARLRGYRFSAVNTAAMPNLDAVRFLVIKFESSYGSLYSLLESFSHADTFTPPDTQAHRGMIQRFYYKTGNRSKKNLDNTGYLREFENPAPLQLQDKIVKHLNDGHPVSVCMDLNPLEKTGSISQFYARAGKLKPKRHCLTIMGYRGDGPQVNGSNVSQYLLRNSWRHSRESRCSEVFINRNLVECETTPPAEQGGSRNQDSGNFWLDAQGMIEIMRHFGEITLIAK